MIYDKMSSFLGNIGQNKFMFSLIIFTYFIFFSLITIEQHHNFKTTAYDLGVFNQIFWNSSQGRLFNTSFYPFKNFLGEHFSLALILLLPLYMIFPAPDMLLIIQVFLMALPAVLLFKIGLRVFDNNMLAILLATAY